MGQHKRGRNKWGQCHVTLPSFNIKYHMYSMASTQRKAPPEKPRVNCSALSSLWYINCVNEDRQENKQFQKEWLPEWGPLKWILALYCIEDIFWCCLCFVVLYSLIL